MERICERQVWKSVRTRQKLVFIREQEHYQANVDTESPENINKCDEKFEEEVFISNNEGRKLWYLKTQQSVIVTKFEDVQGANIIGTLRGYYTGRRVKP